LLAVIDTDSCMVDADELEWYVPAAIVPAELQSTLGVIRQYLAFPFDLDGKKASALLGKKTRRRQRRRSPTPESDADDDDRPKKAKKEKRKKEKEVYKSAAMIEDSDEEYGDIEAFLEKEKALREKTERIAMEGGKLPTMKSTGTKKRRREAVKKVRGKKKRKADDETAVIDTGDDSSHSESSSVSASGGSLRKTSPPKEQSPAEPKPRPKPKPRYKGTSSRAFSPSIERSEDTQLEDSVRPQRKKRVVVSDDEE
jgi:replication fork protection complex subunit Tof1/Swi1